MFHYYNVCKDELTTGPEGLTPSDHYIKLGPASEAIDCLLRGHGFTEQNIRRILGGTMPDATARIIPQLEGSPLADIFSAGAGDESVQGDGEKNPETDNSVVNIPTELPTVGVDADNADKGQAQEQPKPQAAPPEIIKKIIAQYIADRDLIKEKEAKLKEELDEIKGFQKKREDFLMGQLNALGVSSMKSEAGSFFKKTSKSVTVSDAALFKGWILEDPATRIDIMSTTANKTAISDMVDAEQPLPPGVNYSTFTVVQVRR